MKASHKGACALSLFFVPAMAAAQPITSDPAGEPAPQPMEQPNEPAPTAGPPVAGVAATAEVKSPTVARTLAVGTTLAGYGMVVGAFFLDGGAMPVLFYSGQVVAAFGPSAGHVYAGETKHALVFSGIRAGALLAANVGVGLLASCVPSEAIGGGSDDTSDCEGDGGGYLLLGGLAVAAGFGLYDWYDSGRAAHRYNRQRATNLQATISPLIDSRRGSYGLAIGGAF